MILWASSHKFLSTNQAQKSTPGNLMPAIAASRRFQNGRNCLSIRYVGTDIPLGSNNAGRCHLSNWRKLVRLLFGLLLSTLEQSRDSYDVDRGFTMTIAMEAAAWEAALDQRGQPVRSLIEAQLNGYDYLVDLATKAEPISEAAIRALHAQLVSAQETYRVVTAIGLQDHPLPKGQYKLLPNHVRRRDGEMHSYAPADLTPAEMFRFVGELRSEEFTKAHPILQASYAHYAIVVIHPFADGNGRVARALSSVFMYRANSIPLLIFADQKGAYLTSLESADRGDSQQFVNFISERALDTLQLVEENLKAAAAPPIEESLAALKSLYFTKGGFSQEEVDKVGLVLLNAFSDELQKQLKGIDFPRLSKSVAFSSVNSSANPFGEYRIANLPTNGLVLTFQSGPPAAAATHFNAYLLVPKDCGREDDLLLYDSVTKESFSARITEIASAMSSTLQIRMKMFVEGFISRALAQIAANANATYRR